MEKWATVVTVDGAIGRREIVEHDGDLWIVTGWLAHKTRPVKRPIRLIRLSGLDAQEGDPEVLGADFLVGRPIPRGILDGTIASEEAGEFVLLDTPAVEFPLSKPN